MRRHYDADRQLIICTNAIFPDALVDEFHKSRRVFLMSMYNPNASKVSVER